MKLAARNLEERACWLISMRWIACLVVFAAVFLGSTVFRLLPHPAALYGIGVLMLLYNTLLSLRRPSLVGRRDDASGRRAILLQVTLDLASLTLLLFFSDLVHNPFTACYFFHVVIASILLPGWTPYFLAGLASFLVGIVLLLQHFGTVPLYPLNLPSLGGAEGGGVTPEGIYLLVTFLAFASSLGITAFFATSLSRYVERVQAKVRQQEKMLGISKLVAGFAHQVNNPLDGLQNCLRQLGDHAGDHPYISESVRRMKAGLDRMALVARKLQEFARPEGMELAEMEVPAVVGAVVRLLEGPCRERNVLLETEVASVPRALGDAYAVQEVLFNICTNALDAMPRGGRLSIRVIEHRDAGVDEDRCVAIDVADTGIGIPADAQDKIFEPFYTTKAATGGTGLGLGLCRMLLSEMGGKIQVRSVEGKGATFRVILPAVSDGGKEARS